MKATIAKLEAKVVDDKAAGGEKEKSACNKQASKEKVGKCPLCHNFHHYESRRGKPKGQTLASAFFSGCLKYMAANVYAISTMIVDKKACTVCTDWRYQR